MGSPSSLRNVLNKLRNADPVGWYDPSMGIRVLRPNDRPFISLRTLAIPLSGSSKPDHILSSGKVTADLEAIATSNGEWIFRGKLHDSSDVFGDQYTVGFAFKFHEPSGGGIAELVHGELGSNISPTPQDVKFTRSGRSIWLVQNWQSIFAAGAFFHLVTSGDLSQPFSDLIDDLKKLFGNSGYDGSIHDATGDGSGDGGGNNGGD